MMSRAVEYSTRNDLQKLVGMELEIEMMQY